MDETQAGATHHSLRGLPNRGVCGVGGAVRYLLEQDIPGSRVGPEPTTDCFTAIMHGEVEGVIPGNALIVDPNKPFRKLNPFGNTFLNR